MIATICYALGIAVGILMIPLLLSETLKSFLSRRPNPIVQETCWLCHRVLGKEVYLYHLARGAHAIVCPACAKQKIHRKNIDNLKENVA